MKLFNKRYLKWYVMAFIAVTAIFLYVLRMLPYSAEDMQKCVVSTEHHYYYVLKSDTTTLLYFKGLTDDTLLIKPSINKEEVIEHSLGCWINSTSLIPSCHGRIATVFDVRNDSIIDSLNVKRIIDDEIINFENILATLRHADTEIGYYIDTHDKSDDGFAEVAEYHDSLKSEIKRNEDIASRLKSASERKTLSIHIEESFFAEYSGNEGKTIKRGCKHVPGKNNGGSTIIQITDEITPDNVTPLNPWHLSHIFNYNDTALIIGRSYLNEKDMLSHDVELIPEAVSGDTLKSFPQLKIQKGSPVFTRNGIFIGLIGSGKLVRCSLLLE